jgi:hypothetical protein
VLAAMMIASVAACSSTSRASSAASASPSTATTATLAPIATASALCSRFVDTLLDVARQRAPVPNTVVAARYAALAGAGRRAGDGIPQAIQHLADALNALAAGSGSQIAMLDATSAVTRRCRQTGHPMSATQARALQQLFQATLNTTPTSVGAAP